jgi:biotin carboxyl carrier protein
MAQLTADGPSMRHLFTLNGRPHEVGLTRPDEGYRLHHDGRSFQVALHPLGGDLFRLEHDGTATVIRLVQEGDRVHVHLDGAAHTLEYTDPVRRYARASGAAAQDIASAPMPGTVVALLVAPGQAVRRGDTLVVIESMKLETAIKAWRDGSVAAVEAAVGRTFERGAALVTLAPAGPEG